MRPADVVSEVFFTFISLVILFEVNTLLFHFNHRKITWQKMILSLILTWILSSLLGNVLYSFITLSIFRPLMPWYIIICIPYVIYNNLYRMREVVIYPTLFGATEVVIENQQLQAENILNQYEALKNQLNPHMLFNSLNTLRSLVREDQDKATGIHSGTFRVLRYTLQGNDSKSVFLKDEIEFVSAYIFLLKMRFEDNLSFDICIDNKYANYYLPPMAVQMLIENAVKHNEISDRHPLNIRIYTEEEELIVTNPVQPKLTATTGTGIGLANLAKRYHLLYKREIQISENEQFTIRIPLISSAS